MYVSRIDALPFFLFFEALKLSLEREREKECFFGGKGNAD